MSNSQRIVFSCALCDAPLRGFQSQVGHQVSCPGCGQITHVPKTAKPSAEGDDWWAIDLPETTLGSTPAPANVSIKRDSAPTTRSSQTPDSSSSKSLKTNTKTPASEKPVGSGASNLSNSVSQVRITCEHCLLPIRVDPKVLGRKVKCPSCKSVFVATSPTDPAPLKPVPETPSSLGELDEFMIPAEPATPKPQRSSVDETDPHAWLSANGFVLNDDPFSANELSGSVPEPIVGPATPQSGGDNSQATKPYRVRCQTCGSTVGVRPSQTGKQVRCPDCHSHFIVPPPPSAQQSQLTPAFPSLPPVSAPLSPASIPQDGREKSAMDYMREAEAAPPDSRDDEFKEPDVKGWFQHIFGMFADAGVLVYLFGLTFLAITMAVIASIPPGPYVQLFGLLQMLSIAILVGISLGCGMTILESTSNGDPKVKGWPSSDPFEWFGHVFVVCAAISVAGMPGFLLGSLTGNTAIEMGTTLLSIFVVFPVVLLGMMDNSSVFSPYSADISLSMKRAPESWFTFYVTSGVLLFLFFAVFILAQALPTFVQFLTLFLMIVFTIFIYMRMLGRLGTEIGKVLNVETEEEA